jgi:putative exporter of polyketide antibiotics
LLAASLLATLFFALALLALTLLSIAICLLLAALLSRRTGLAWLVRILLCFHYYLSLFIFDRFFSRLR